MEDSESIQNPFLTAQSTQIKSVISVPIKDFIHHYPRALFNDIPMVGAHFYDIPGSGRTFTTYPGRDALLRHTRVGAQFNDIPGSEDMEDSLNSYLEEITAYLKNNFLLISAPKSSITLFTPDTHQAKTHPRIFIEDSWLPLVQCTKISGVHMDTSPSFNKHSRESIRQK